MAPGQGTHGRVARVATAATRPTGAGAIAATPNCPIGGRLDNAGISTATEAWVMPRQALAAFAIAIGFACEAQAQVRFAPPEASGVARRQNADAARQRDAAPIRQNVARQGGSRVVVTQPPTFFFGRPAFASGY
ncbi:MAG: hypothetical protein AAGG46_12560, partial [Planctomycetota bacterium]